MGAYNEMVKLYESANPDKPDPKVEEIRPSLWPPAKTYAVSEISGT
jgi:hypothetical protein